MVCLARVSSQHSRHKITMGVDAVMNVPADFDRGTDEGCFSRIFNPDAVKIGMTSSVDTIEAIAAGLVKV
mgnify:CR=1 FL=1